MKTLDDLQKRLCESATNRAERIAARYAKVLPEYEHDIRSAAYLGAVRAAASFQSTGMWERWSTLHIKGEVRTFLREYWPTRHDRTAMNSEKLIGELLDKSPPPHDEAKDGFHALLENLTPRRAS